MKNYSASDRLRDLLADNPLLLPALSRFGISLGFGDATVSDVCHASGVHLPTFINVARFISKKPFDPAEVSPAALTAYLRSAHNYFIDYVLPSIRRRLIEAISSGASAEISLAILKFYDDYAAEVRRHMEFEDSTVFAYVDSLLAGHKASDGFSIADFRRKHQPIAQKLHELKELLICHFTAESARIDMLNSLLFDIVICERDLIMHCRVEDGLFIPAVERLEQQTPLPSPEVADESVSDLDEHGDQPLTAREREIIRAIAAGKSNKEIADALCLSVHTVATHRRNICAKLNIHSAAGIAVFAMMHNLA